MFLFSVPSIAQTERSQAAVAPLSTLGNISKTQKEIVFNRLLDEISEHYDIVPQKQYKNAEKLVTLGQESGQCSVDQCFRDIQEVLQVENLYILRIVSEGKDIQLSLTLIDLDKKTIRSDFCEKCNTKTLQERVEKLFDIIFYNKDEETESHAKKRAPFDAAAETWSLIKTSSNPIDFEEFINVFPKSPQSKVARFMLRKLKRDKTSSP